MISIMIVEDEDLIRLGIKSIIESQGDDFNVISMACDGKEALKKFICEPVDIVITDIAMPNMNGLELIYEIRKFKDDVRFIILSGYDQFSYAKRGIELEVSNYILKPINEDELMGTLQEIRDKIKSRIAKDKSTLKRSRKDILYKLIHGSLKDEEVDKKIVEVQQALGFKFYSVWIIAFEKIDECEGEKRKEIYSFIERLNNDKRVLIWDNHGDIVCLSGEDMILEMERNEESFIRNLIQEIKSRFGSNVYVTGGKILEGAEKIYDGYLYGKEQQKFLLIDGYNNVVDAKERVNFAGDVNCIKGIDIKAFSRVLMMKNKEEIKKYIRDDFCKSKECFKNNPEKIRDRAIRMAVRIQEVHDEFNIKSTTSLERIINEIYEDKTLSEIENKLYSLSAELMGKLQDNFMNRSPIINRILDHIDKEYSGEISLKILGAKFNINPTYLGQLFLKEVGCGFSEYLNRVKNERTRDLILNTDMKINEIAKIMGYSDTSYFYRKFKEYHGISPKTLRLSKKY